MDLKLKSPNYSNALDTTARIGAGAAIAGGLAATGMDHIEGGLEAENADLTEKFGKVINPDSIEVQAGAVEMMRDGNSSIKDIIMDKTRIIQGDDSISLQDAKNHIMNNEKLNAVQNVTPGIIGGSAALGAIGAGIGALGKRNNQEYRR